jgi:acetyltransferase-like isoleucine patch superfamily enzyme
MSELKPVRPDDPQGSKKKGIAGIFETLLRKFKTIVHILLIIPLYIFASGILGISLVPGIMLVRWTFIFAKDWNLFLNAFAIGTAVVASFFICGLAAMIILPMFNKIFVGSLKEWKGPYYSLEAIKWYIHNGILYMLRYSFLEFVTPSPFSLWFYQAMGMKIGRGTVINSTHISDPSLIEIGKKVTIGGSATIVAHYGQSGFLVLAPVKIGDGVTVGLKATIMGGVVIGENAKILPNSVLLPKTVVPPNELWGGVPAHKYELRKAVS